MCLLRWVFLPRRRHGERLQLWIRFKEWEGEGEGEGEGVKQINVSFATRKKNPLTTFLFTM